MKAESYLSVAYIMEIYLTNLFFDQPNVNLFPEYGLVYGGVGYTSQACCTPVEESGDVFADGVYYCFKRHSRGAFLLRQLKHTLRRLHNSGVIRRCNAVVHFLSAGRSDGTASNAPVATSLRWTASCMA